MLSRAFLPQSKVNTDRQQYAAQALYVFLYGARLSARPLAILRDAIFLYLVGGISIKFATNIRHWCVRLNRLLVGFRTHLKSMHFHSFIHVSGHCIAFHC